MRIWSEHLPKSENEDVDELIFQDEEYFESDR